MLAIAVLRSRVAPVLDWCSRFLIYPEAVGEDGGASEVFFESSGRYEVLERLRERGVGSVICGALTRELLDYAEHLGMQVIYGVAGSIPEIFRAYQINELDRPEFRLPGCRGPCRYRRRLSNMKRLEEEPMEKRGQGGQGKGRGRQKGCRGLSAERGTRKNGQQAGRGSSEQGLCLCPACGTEVPHQRGIPCTQVHCPQCGRPMQRKGKE